MKRLLSLILPAVIILSCSDPVEVKDNSFSISAKAFFDESTLESTLYLTLDNGCPQKTYTISCGIDANPSLSFSQSVKFDDAFMASIRLPELEIGEHEITLHCSTDEYSQETSCSLNVTVGDFSIHAEVSTASSTTSNVLVSLTSGRKDEKYGISVSTDGAKVAEEKGVDFSKTPIVSIPLPLMRPGNYTLTVDCTDGRGTKNSEVKFTEPLRHTDLNMEIARSTSTGKTRFRITSNPYDLSVAVYDSLVVKGRCDYHVCSYIEERIDNKTSYLQNCDIVDLPRFQPNTGTWYNLTDTQTKEDIITSQSIANTKWSGHWDDGGDGGWIYTQEPDGYSYYKIVSSRHNLTIAFEVIDGITVNVTNSERDVILNGVSIPNGKYSYELK